MAKIRTIGGGRVGAIRGRSQFLLPNGHWAKRDTKTGEILSVKADYHPYKGVVIEKFAPFLLATGQAAQPMGRRQRATLQPLPGRPAWLGRQRRVRPATAPVVALPSPMEDEAPRQAA